MNSRGYSVIFYSQPELAAFRVSKTNDGFCQINNRQKITITFEFNR